MDIIDEIEEYVRKELNRNISNRSSNTIDVCKNILNEITRLKKKYNIDYISKNNIINSPCMNCKRTSSPSSCCGCDEYNEWKQRFDKIEELDNKMRKENSNCDYLTGYNNDKYKVDHCYECYRYDICSEAFKNKIRRI